MRWPWQKPERRQGYGDVILNAALAQAEGKAATAAATGALEACASLYAAAFAAARIEGASPAVESALSPAVRADIGRDLIRLGEAVHLIETGRGLRLARAASWNFQGGPDPADWMARVTLNGPSETLTRVVPHAAVTHCRYATDHAQPWRGVGPLGWAAATGRLAGALETMLANEAGAPSAQLLPIPQDGGDGGDDDPLAALKADIAKAEGRAVLVETTAGGWGAGMGGAPARDWRQTRIGADFPEVLQRTRRDVAESVMQACNVPAVLMAAGAEGTSQREGLRRFAHLAVEPLGRIVAAELADKLDAPALGFDFDPLMAADVAGRARAYKAFREGGLSAKQAARIVAVES